jgi:hypothetical protein
MTIVECTAESVSVATDGLRTTLSFITTDECSARCAHCLMDSGPDRPAKLTYDQIREKIDTIALAQGYRLVVFTGGECTRLGEDLLDAISYAQINGLITRVVTNAEWATSDEATTSMITALREAGLDEINFSYDDFHRVWIPESNLVRAWRATKNQGFDTALIALASGARSHVTPNWVCQILGENLPLAYDPESGDRLPLPAPAPDGTRYLVSNSRLLRIGRGRGLRDGYATFPEHQETVLLQSCPPQNRDPVITPRNHVAACCGINPDGNAVLDFGEQRCGPDDVQKVILGAIHRLGPGHLLQMAREGDVAVRARTRYASICEVCADVTANPDVVAYLTNNIDRLAEDVAAAAAIASIAARQEHRA